MARWTALNPSYTTPNILPPQKPSCGYARKYAVGWVSECDRDAIFVRTNEEEDRPEYACADHAR